MRVGWVHSVCLTLFFLLTGYAISDDDFMIRIATVEQGEWTGHPMADEPSALEIRDKDALLTDDPDSDSNRPVELIITLPEGICGHMGHIELFVRSDLVSPSNWMAGDCWIPTYGSRTVSWEDPASPGEKQRFYLASTGADTDGDGHSDLYEAWVGGTDSNLFNEVNEDGDDLHDWLELKIFGDLSQTAADDFDHDGLLNGEELVAVSPDRPAIMISNPVLFDSDRDGLGDFTERVEFETDPMRPDTDLDGIGDAAEVFGCPPTDPVNPDTSPPVVLLAGG